MKIFVDTGAFYALIDRDDPYHLSARKCWSEILAGEDILVLTNYIVSESYTLLRYRLSFQVAADFMERLEASVSRGRTLVVSGGKEYERRAREILLDFREQDLSYTDGISLAVIEILHIPRVFSYDRHFSLAGVKVVPGRGQ